MNRENSAPLVPAHPGKVLQGMFLRPLGIDEAEAAKRLAMPLNTLSELLAGKIPLSAELAIRLELAGLQTARSWLIMQLEYQLWEAGKNDSRPLVRWLSDAGEPTFELNHTQLLGLPPGAKIDAAEIYPKTICARLVGFGYRRVHLQALCGQLTSHAIVDSESEAWIRITRYIAMANAIVGNPTQTAEWMQKKNVVPGKPGAPLDLLATREGADRVEELLQRFRATSSA